MNKSYPKGLTTVAANERILQEGLNWVEEKKVHPLYLFLQKFWAPVPWMLEVTIILELILQKYQEASIIAILLLFNASLSFFQENRANKALALLRSHLQVRARVLRDGLWQWINTEQLVREDVVHLRMGDIIPADIQITDGLVMVDQSMLTGEAMPVEVLPGQIAYSGAIIKEGEATGCVNAVGGKTYFGKTVSLLQEAKTISHIREIIFNIVKYLITFSSLLAVFILIYAFIVDLPFANLIPFILVLLIAAIPAALPATFTLATALSAVHLVKQGVLVTRLSAIEEASVLDIICVDKTGTITQNKISIAASYAIEPFTDDQLIGYAALASNEATQDPIDNALIYAANERNLLDPSITCESFVPFDPSTKCMEVLCEKEGDKIHIVKGALPVILDLVPVFADLTHILNQFGEKAYRVLAVAISHNGDPFSLVGLIGLQDLPREDSKEVIAKLKDLGLRILMLTGDNPSTAKRIAEDVGIGNRMCSAELLKEQPMQSISECDVFANLYPEDKFYLVKNLQRAHHIVGMTGDGVNDAPSLKQAEVGFAVTSATDVAKAAASVVLIRSGLSGILSTVETSRRIYRRMRTYIVNKISKSVEISVFLTVGVFTTGELLLTPLLMVLLMFANDFVTMAIATDHVTFSKQVERWQIKRLMLRGGIIGGMTLLLSLATFYYTHHVLQLSLPQLQTMVFLLLVFTAQANVYMIREEGHFWNSMPSKWLILSTVVAIIGVSLMAGMGILMTPISFSLIAGLLLVTIAYLLISDIAKVYLFKRIL